ncbi:MAG: hypothetical protein ACXACW_16330 [Candidatus Hodarchaeales archaeon]|jgi:hypothetical protein
MAITRDLDRGNTIMVLGSLDADYYYTTDFPNHNYGVRVLKIQYVPSGLADRCLLKNASSNGVPVMYCSSVNNFESHYFNGERLKIFYDVSDTNNVCTASANAKIIIHLGGKDI